jgi:hypothetical protein
MTAGNKKLTQKIVAVIVIVTLLDMVGVSPIVMIFFTGVGFLIWRAAQRAENRETERIFDFYLSADEILREKERHWYGFEIAEVIETGERVLNSMPDPPPLSNFALGALYHKVADYEATAEHLLQVVEDESAAEYRRNDPSPQLRRYVETLRRIERQPAVAPQVLAAVRSLERGRQRNAAQLLAESRERLSGDFSRTKQNPSDSFAAEGSVSIREAVSDPFARSLSAITAPPPICEVLHDVYQDEKKTA